MSPLGITLLMLAGFAVFAALAWRKLAIVAALASDDRFDHRARDLPAARNAPRTIAPSIRRPHTRFHGRGDLHRLP
jgi:hypothetical protein